MRQKCVDQRHSYAAAEPGDYAGKANSIWSGRAASGWPGME
jgi:hypothetical protein